jgi:hypothetical protein
MSSTFLWGAVVGAAAAWFLFRRCPNCGRSMIDPGALLAHGPQAAG